MKKKLISLLITAAMIMTFLPVTVSAAESINIGEYVQMGTYYGAPILWRCVDIDENGPLMLSDKIICIKPFDAAGDNTSGSHGRGYNDGEYRKQYGSNYWADSNIRCWLNSDASAGNVNWTCGNAPTEDKVYQGYNDYADEAGFLTNFTLGERNAIKPVTQKSLLDGYEYDSNNRDSNYHRDNSDINDVLQNYDTAYSEQVTDSVFLLDVKQVNAVYNNSNVLGDKYYVGEPTEQCVSNSEYVSSSLRTGNKWYYWLRSPDAYNSYGSHDDRYVTSGGYVSNHNAYHDKVGVRPAFYLNLLSASFTSGSGTAAAPYTVEGSGSYTPATVAPTPTPTAQPTSLKIYCNEPSLSTTVGNSFLIGAALTDEDENYSSASGITFDVEDSGILKAVKTTDDENTRYITFNAVGTGTTTIKITDGKSWQTAELPFTVNKASANAYTIYNIPNIGSDDANFYNFTGLYIDSFKVNNKSNGSAELSFDVYNQNPTYGTVEVYDVSGELIDAEIIGKTAFETSIVSIWGTVTEIGKDISEGVYNPMSYKSSIQSKKTEIRNLSVPAGGYIKISVDTRESSVCGIINALDLISQTSGLVSNAKKQEDVPKTAIEKLKNNGNKFLEQYQTKFVKELTNKTIGSTEDLTSYLSNIANMFLNGDLRELAVSVLASSAVGTAESAVMDWLKQAGNPAQAGLSAFWKISKIDNLIYQTAMFAKRANCGSITIQVPDGNVRRCSDITVKCTMNNNTAVEVCRTDINGSLLATIKNLNKNIFGSSQIIGYDINLVEDGEVIQPDGTAEVTINIPEWMQSGKNISVYRAENDGSVTDMNGKVSGDAITFETDHFSTYILSADGIEVDPPETAEGQTVVNGDTIVSDWAAEEVQEAFDEELVPDILHGADLTKKVDRAEFAAIAVTLYENLSKKTAQTGENPFGDISGNYCENDILKAYNLGITNGITNVTFEPSTLISREQVATMLTRAYKKSEFPGWTLETDGNYPLNYMGVTKYADDDEISDYARESVYFMTRWDILNGVDDSHFAPKNNTTLGESYGYATREQAVVIALRSAKHL